jgi:hypothetical protein
MSLHGHIKTIVGPDVIVLIKGIVESVDKGTDTMVLNPINGSAQYVGVKLQSIDNTEGSRADIVRYPAIGSLAVIGLLQNDYTDTFMITASKYDSVNIKIDSVTLDADSLVINGGRNKGMVNLTPLVAKINKLETTLNQLIASFKTHLHTGVTTGAGVSGPTATPSPALIAPVTKNADLEDTKVKH